MKKALTICISVALVVAALFACVVFTNAATNEVFASTVEVTLRDGTVVFLGEQPVYGPDPDDATATVLTGYDENNVLSILKPEKGSLVFDHTTGTLTITDVEGVASIKTYTGSLVLVVKGENVFENPTDYSVLVSYLEYVDPDADPKEVKSVGNLTIKGDGTLTCSSDDYAICSQAGSIEFTDDVKVNVTVKNSDCVHTSSATLNNGNIIFSGNAKVVCNSFDQYAVRVGGAKGYLYVTDNADVTINAIVKTSWKGGLRTTNFEITGGKLTANVENEETKTAQAIVGLDIQGANGVANFKGGTVTVNVNNKHRDRGYGIFFKTLPTVNFDGTNVNIDVKNSVAASNNAIIANQSGTTAINITAGKFNITGDNNTTGIFGNNVEGSTITITGGTFVGSAKSVFYSQGANYSLKITGGVFDVTASDKVLTYSNTSKTCNQSQSDSAYQIAADAKTIKVGTVGEVPPVSGTFTGTKNTVLTPAEVTSSASKWADLKLALGNGTTLSLSQAKAVEVVSAKIYTLSGNTLSIVDNSSAEDDALPWGIITLTKNDGTTVVLSKQNREFYPETGSLVLEGNVLTVTDVTGIRTINGADDYTIVFKGVNTFNNDKTAHTLKGAKGLTIEGDGVIHLNAGADKSYPVLSDGGKLMIRGDVTLNVTSMDPNVANTDTPQASIHAARGNGESLLVIGGNAVLNIKNPYSRALYSAGETSSVVIRDNAKVTAECKGDFICAVSDSDLAYEGAPGAYVEISGTASVTAESGSCGIRANVSHDLTKYSGLRGKAATSEIVIGGMAEVKMSVAGQGLYAVDGKKANDSKHNANITISGSPKINIINVGDYAALHMNSDENVFTMTGGVLELAASKQGAFKIDGKTLYDFGSNSLVKIVGGDDASSAEKLDKMSTSVKYLKISFENKPTPENPSTSDVNVVSFVVAATLVAVVAVAIALRKKYSCE